MKRTDAQNKRFHTLLSTLGYGADEKEGVVLKFSDGRVCSSADMTAFEMAKAIKHLEDILNDSMNRMRTKAVNIAREIGVIKQKAGLWDYAPLNQWIEKHYGVRTIFLLNYDELAKAVTGLEQWQAYEKRKKVKQLSCL